MKVVFLDRDGVINQYPGDGEYVTKVQDLHILPGAVAAIKKLNEKGFTVFVISNQAGVSKGVYSMNKLQRITRAMLLAVEKGGGKIKKVYYCTHRLEDNCTCRKPKIGSIERALKLVNHSTNKKLEAYCVGDTIVDILAGKRAGCKTIFVLSGRETRRSLRKWHVHPDYIVKDLLEASKIISREKPRHVHTYKKN